MKPSKYRRNQPLKVAEVTAAGVYGGRVGYYQYQKGNIVTLATIPVDAASWDFEFFAVYAGDVSEVETG